MALERDNIIIGAAKFWISDPATPTAEEVASGNFTQEEPAGISVAIPATGVDPMAAGPGADWREIGYTTEGVEVSYEPDYADVEVDQLLDSAIIFKQGMRVTVNTTMAEASLRNLLIAWGQKPTAGDGANRLTISSGELGEFPVERSLLFRGPAPRGTTVAQRWYYLERAIQTESTAFALRRAEATTLPASFRCLPNDDGDYGAIVDRTRAAA